ncbi:MAG: Kae1-associated serine/threonine protein kinase [Nanoarchaeota archaeon]|nr:Kae1-associated serine/threonine protein kinase [Nanoarchaeota archaeon]
MKEIARGAEAVLYENGESIVKIRPRKTYRILEIDQELRKRRTKKEASLLEKLKSEGIRAPTLIETDNSERIEMQNLGGKQVKLVLDKQPELAKQIGQELAKFHEADIIHSDLTTSNMILKDKEVYFIDFGLSFHSARIEDKAVDIHLFLQALESRHHKVKEVAYNHFLEGYKEYREFKNVLERLIAVEKRGRYRGK